MKIDRKKVLIIAGYALLVGSIFFTIYTQILAYKTSLEGIDIEKELIAKAEKNLEFLNNLQQNEAEMAKQLRVLDEAIPSTANEYETIYYIENALEFPTDELLNINFSSKVQRDDYGELPIKIDFSGYYHGLVAFLNNLQGGPKIVRINGIKISRGSEGFPQIKAEIDLSTFYTLSK